MQVANEIDGPAFVDGWLASVEAADRAGIR
jgi:hypothetical protein